MILYATQKTVERLKLKMPDELSPEASMLAKAVIARDAGNPQREWGLKLFYLQGRKCLQAVHFASKLTLFLFDIKISELETIGPLMAEYMLDIYANDAEMTRCLHRMFAEDQCVAFAALKNRSIIATLNHMQTDYAWDGERFLDYVENGILHTRKINRDVNFHYPVTYLVDGKKQYEYPAEVFRQQLIAHDG